MGGGGGAALQPANRRAEWEGERDLGSRVRERGAKKTPAPRALSPARGTAALTAPPHRASDVGMRDLGGEARAHTAAGGERAGGTEEETALDPVRKKK